jgi:hypothetical protein
VTGVQAFRRPGSERRRREPRSLRGPSERLGARVHGRSNVGCIFQTHRERRHCGWCGCSSCSSFFFAAPGASAHGLGRARRFTRRPAACISGRSVGEPPTRSRGSRPVRTDPPVGLVSSIGCTRLKPVRVPDEMTWHSSDFEETGQGRGRGGRPSGVRDHDRLSRPADVAASCLGLGRDRVGPKLGRR